jgi:integrase
LKLTIAQYLERWLDEHAGHAVSGETLERYAELLRLHAIPVIGRHPLTRLAPLHIQACHSAMRVRGLSAQTVKHCHRVLSQALRQAVRLRLLASNPADAVDAPRVARTEMKVLDQVRTVALLKAAEGSSVYPPVLLAVTTGMRRGEIIRLHWKDLDLDRRSLSVAQTLEETKAKGPRSSRRQRPSARAARSCISITLDVYSHLIPGMQEDAASRIDAALRVHLDR